MTGDYYGLPTRIISNQYLRMEFLAEAGPRIVRLMLANSDENLLAETPDLSWPTPYGQFHLYGGHRLWHAPEAPSRSSIPDNEGLTVEERDGVVHLVQPPEPVTAVRKSIAIRLHEDRPAATVSHELWNGGAWPIELAPWAITQVPTGGAAILPQPAEPLEHNSVLPNRHLVLWPYTRWQDPRLRLGDEVVLVQAQPISSILKIGYMNHHGWVGYLRAGRLLVKRFASQPRAWHADLGCNAEVYCSERFLELETLGPLCRLEPGQSVTHVETWELYTGLEALGLTDDAKTIISQWSV